MTPQQRQDAVSRMTREREHVGNILASLEQLYIDLEHHDSLERQVEETVDMAINTARRLHSELGAVRDDLGRMARAWASR
jgi:hypothetical protein